MYFGVDVNGGHHLWRQRFPNAEPEQITSGPTEEDGVAIAPDGRSLITSIGMQQNALWIHDAKGDRALSFRGNVAHPDRTGLPGTIPVFSRDGKSLFYLRSESPGAPTELWKFNLDVERSEKALPGVSILEFSISDDATEVVYSAQSSDGHAQIWIAPLDRSTPPQLISPSEADSPHFGPNGRIVFRSFDGTKHYLAQMDHDGSARSKLASYPIGTLMFTSPDRHWITTVTTMPDGIAGTYAVPVDGGTPQRICSGCPVMWAPDAQFLYLAVRGPGIGDPGKTRVVPLRAGKMLPRLPPLGIRNLEDSALLSDSFVIDAGGISPGPDPSVYAYVKTTMHRNLFQIPLH
jgi:Tol biopolymer transport system component